MNQRQFEILNMLVEFNTESPPGRNTDPLQNEIELLLRDLGFSIQRNTFMTMIVSLWPL